MIILEIKGADRSEMYFHLNGNRKCLYFTNNVKGFMVETTWQQIYVKENKKNVQIDMDGCISQIYAYSLLLYSFLQRIL